MSKKKLPLESERLLSFAKKVGTPFYLYDGDEIEKNALEMISSFSFAPSFTNYFAVKALPNVNILKMLSSLGFGADCSSLPELLIAQEAGLKGDKIMFTSNDTPPDEFKKAIELGAILNLDDISHIERVREVNNNSLPDTISFRFNPGRERTGNAIIGNPVEAKYGLTRDQLFSAYNICKDEGVKHFYLHTMVASNELDESYIVETARMLFSLVKEIKVKCGVTIEGVDLGGGVGIPYKEEQNRIEWKSLASKIEELYRSMILSNNLGPLKISFECGRAITGPYGYLVSTVRHVTEKYKSYVGLDASMADLMRPALYGAYHHITVLGKENEKKDHIYDVTGSLCENNDKFAINRALPQVERGDIVVLHDAGAHSHAMGFNYNGKLRHAEYLIKNGKISKIRRDESYSDYVSTVLKEPEEITF